MSIKTVLGEARITVPTDPRPSLKVLLSLDKFRTVLQNSDVPLVRLHGEQDFADNGSDVIKDKK